MDVFFGDLEDSSAGMLWVYLSQFQTNNSIHNSQDFVRSYDKLSWSYIEAASWLLVNTEI